MVVLTKRRGNKQEGQLDLLLANHRRLSTCEKNWKLPVQDYCYRYGVKNLRLLESVSCLGHGKPPDQGILTNAFSAANVCGSVQKYKGTHAYDFVGGL